MRRSGDRREEIFWMLEERRVDGIGGRLGLWFVVCGL